MTWYGPAPYRQFSDSPFYGMLWTYFYLEDMEDGAVDTPGVTVVAQGGYVTPSGDGATDSVDSDDGVIDGNGVDGRSYWGWASPGVDVRFEAAVLGALPTHAGIVWTDGSNPIIFEAFDNLGASLGTVTGNHAGYTIVRSDDDRFYGVFCSSGLSAIRISSPSAAIEVDHIQYGVPEPTSLSLLGLGVLGLLWRKQP